MLSEHEMRRIAELVAASLAKRVETNEQMLNVHEAAKLLGCWVPTLERRTRDGRIPSIKIGRLRRYRRSDIVNIADAS